jgi:L-fuculose-phosphate aldolase
MHGAIYAARPDVNAIIHTHSIYATSLAVAGLTIPALMDEMVIYLGDSVQIANYGFPSSEELADEVVKALGERNAVLMKNHGVVTVGHTMTEALHSCHLVEHLAHIYFNVKSLGIDPSLDPTVLAHELTLFRIRQRTKLLKIALS